MVWVYTQTPLTYVAPFESAAVFTTKECVAGKNLTVGSTQILYSGGAPVTYPTIAAWLESYKTGMGMHVQIHAGARALHRSLPT